MGSIDVASTIKTSSGLTVQYSIPETEGGWHCAGANLNVKGDLVELSFVAAHDADDGVRVDLPAENTKRPNIHQVHIPLHGLNEFSLVIDGKHHAGFVLGRTAEKTGEQDANGNQR
jgi:hypothetical protein